MHKSTLESLPISFLRSHFVAGLQISTPSRLLAKICRHLQMADQPAPKADRHGFGSVLPNCRALLRQAIGLILPTTPTATPISTTAK
jgi:hypothetical protein